MTVSSASIKVKDYDSDTYGARFRGHLERWQCLMLLRDELPIDAVPIPETLRFEHHTIMVQPHPECRAEHKMEFELWTTASMRVFQRVDYEHHKVVQSLGQKNRTVRVPVMEELTVDYVR